jgi:uncharacterized membrane protein
MRPLRRIALVCLLCAVATTTAPAHGGQDHGHNKADHAGKKHGHHGHAGKHSNAAKADAPAAPKAEQKPAPTEATEAVEAVEAVEPVEAVEDAAVQPAADGNVAAKPGTATEKSLWARSSQATGHMHAAVIHLPIAWVMLWFALEVLGLYAGQTQLAPVGPWLGVASTLSFIPATVSGLLRFDELARAAADAHTMDPALLHRNLMYGCMATCALACGVRLLGPRRWPNRWRPVFITLLGLTFVAVSYSAHLGGQLVYGEDFLPF